MFEFPPEWVRKNKQIDAEYFFSYNNQMPPDAQAYADKIKKPFPECFFPYIIDISKLSYDEALLFFTKMDTPLSEYITDNIKHPWIYWIVNSKKCIMLQSEADAARLTLYV